MSRTTWPAPAGIVALLLVVGPAAHAAPVSEDFGAVHAPEGSYNFGYFGSLADVNGDGWLDLVAVDTDNERPAAARGVWLSAGSSGGLEPALTSLVDAYHLGHRAVVADLMGLGEAQILTARFDDQLAPKVELRRLDAELPVATWPAEVGMEEDVWAAGDLDGDGRPEILVLADVIEHPSSADTTGIWAVLGWRDGALRQVGELTVENAKTSGSRVRVADVDRDGLDDVVISGTGTVTLFRGANGTLPTAPSATWYGGNAGPGIILGDFDGDGDQELAVGEPYAQSDPNSLDLAGQIQVYDNVDGIPEPTPAKTLVRPTGADEIWLGRLLVAGDFDDDGFDDLAAVANTTGGDLVWIFRGGLEGLEDRPVQALAHGDDPVWSLIAGDVDGDGVQDLVIGTMLALSEGSEHGAFYLHLGTGEVPEDDAATGDPDADVEDAAGEPAVSEGSGGCGCVTGDSGPSSAWALLGALLWMRRTRSDP